MDPTKCCCSLSSPIAKSASRIIFPFSLNKGKISSTCVATTHQASPLREKKTHGSEKSDTKWLSSIISRNSSCQFRAALSRRVISGVGKINFLEFSRNILARF